MIGIVLCVLFLTEMVATISTYRLRRTIFTRYPTQYDAIGYRDSDGAYLDCARTVISIPFRMRTSGLPRRVRAQILLLRIHRIAFALITIPAFLYLVV